MIRSKQGLTAGLVGFAAQIAAQIAAQLVAEGVETAEELNALIGWARICSGRTTWVPQHRLPPRSHAARRNPSKAVPMFGDVVIDPRVGAR